MKKVWKRLVAVGLILSSLLLLYSCASDEVPDGSDSAQPPYDEARLSEYLAPLTYCDMTVDVERGEEKDQAVLTRILQDAEVLEYPEEQVDYYEAQMRTQYHYLAKQKDMSYDEYLESKGYTDQTIREEACRMVKTDLVLLYIVRDAGLSLTEDEKTNFYDRYAEKYVESGYDRAYVDEHMRELIYETMLFDKTMEYLILHNIFEVSNG